MVDERFEGKPNLTCIVGPPVQVITSVFPPLPTEALARYHCLMSCLIMLILIDNCCYKGFKN